MVKAFSPKFLQFLAGVKKTTVFLPGAAAPAPGPAVAAGPGRKPGQEIKGNLFPRGTDFFTVGP